MPRSPTPVGPSCLAMRTTCGSGELLLPAARRLRVFFFFFLAAGASVRSASLSRRLAARQCCPRSSKRRGPQRQSSFSGLNHAASALAVYASQHASQRHHARLACSRWPTFAARASLPLGSLRGFCSYISSFLLAKLCLAQFEFELALALREGIPPRGEPSAESKLRDMGQDFLAQDAG